MAACLALPVAALADQPSNNGAGPGGQDQRQHQGQGQGQGGQQAPSQKQARPTGQAPAAGARPTQGAPARGPGAGGAGQQKFTAPGAQTQPGQRPAGHTRTQGQPTGQAPVTGTGAHPKAVVPGAQLQQGQRPAGQSQTQGRPTGQAPATGARPGQGAATGAGVQAPRGQRPANTPQLGGWSRTARGPAQVQAGQQWRQGHRGWDQSAPWRRDRNWWRGNSAFSLYLGPRVGFFFIPDMGYISVPHQYRNHHWQAGQYLPNWFWRYEVNDYWNYGLPEPPDGCAWVWVNNDVALVDLSDGYILDIVHNAW